MSAPCPPCTRPCWVMAVLILACLAVMAWWAMGDPLVTNADRPPKDIYDDQGRRVP